VERRKRIKEYAIEHRMDLEKAEKKMNEEERRKSEAKRKKEAERSRKAQKLYRERHGEDLKKARRVANALMALRKKEYYNGEGRHRRGWGLNTKDAILDVVRRLSEFLTKEERESLLKEFTPEAELQRAKKREAAAKEWAAFERKRKKQQEAAMRKIEGKGKGA
jgi:hypothetical protein